MAITKEILEHDLTNELDFLTRRLASLHTEVPLNPSTQPISSNMPCMYTPQSHLPLTPPEYPPEYLQQYGGYGMNQHTYSIGSQSVSKESFDFGKSVDAYQRKMAPAYVGSTHAYHPQSTVYSGLPPPGISHPNAQFYPSSSASLTHQSQPRVELPPLIDDNYHTHHRQETRRAEPIAPVEEKPVGGVAVHLDYDMEEMTDFVATMAQRLVNYQGNDRIQPSFRKFVFQILSSTRLPSSTILLGLVYLRERTQLCPGRSDNIYPVLTVALLLASKFLDDNTFQNKSWAEVTNISVIDLNALEKEWLREIKWHLHVDPEGTKGFSQYKTMWDAWVRNRNQKSTTAPALAPIKTNLHIRPSQTAFSPTPLYPSHQQYQSASVAGDRHIRLPPPRTSLQDSRYWWSSPAEHSPPSAPETGPTTPEGYFGWSSAFGPQASIPQQQYSYARLPPIMPPYQQTPHWSGHRHCGCWHCQNSPEMHSQFYLPSLSQPVAA